MIDLGALVVVEAGQHGAPVLLAEAEGAVANAVARDRVDLLDNGGAAVDEARFDEGVDGVRQAGVEGVPHGLTRAVRGARRQDSVALRQGARCAYHGQRRHDGVEGWLRDRVARHAGHVRERGGGLPVKLRQHVQGHALRLWRSWIKCRRRCVACPRAFGLAL